MYDSEAILHELLDAWHTKKITFNHGLKYTNIGTCIGTHLILYLSSLKILSKAVIFLMSFVEKYPELRYFFNW